MKKGDIDMKCQCCGERLPEGTISSKKTIKVTELGRRLAIHKIAVCPSCQYRTDKYYYTDMSTKHITLGGQEA